MDTADNSYIHLQPTESYTEQFFLVVPYLNLKETERHVCQWNILKSDWILTREIKARGQSARVLPVSKRSLGPYTLETQDAESVVRTTDSESALPPHTLRRGCHLTLNWQQALTSAERPSPDATFHLHPHSNPNERVSTSSLSSIPKEELRPRARAELAQAADATSKCHKWDQVQVPTPLLSLPSDAISCLSASTQEPCLCLCSECPPPCWKLL